MAYPASAMPAGYLGTGGGSLGIALLLRGTRRRMAHCPPAHPATLPTLEPLCHHALLPSCPPSSHCATVPLCHCATVPLWISLGLA